VGGGGRGVCGCECECGCGCLWVGKWVKGGVGMSMGMCWDVGVGTSVKTVLGCRCVLSEINNVGLGTTSAYMEHCHLDAFSF